MNDYAFELDEEELKKFRFVLSVECEEKRVVERVMSLVMRMLPDKMCDKDTKDNNRNSGYDYDKGWIKYYATEVYEGEEEKTAREILSLIKAVRNKGYDCNVSFHYYSYRDYESSNIYYGLNHSSEVDPFYQAIDNVRGGPLPYEPFDEEQVTEWSKKLRIKAKN